MLEDEEFKESDELFEHHRITVDKGQSLIRIDKFLQQHLKNASRTKIQDAAEAGNIRINQIPVKSNYRVKPGDIITILLSHPPRDTEIIPENIPLDIRYEDEFLLVVNKPAGMVVHPAYGNYTGTLVNALAWHLKDHPMFQPGDVRPGLVHRIDKNTSGILVIAKSDKVLQKLARQFFEHTVNRTYNALVWGDFKEEKGTITGHIGRSIRDRKKMTVYEDGSQGKHAVTHYKILERFGYTSLVECKLETGRTHQIRAHFQHIKHPLFNDGEYGGNVILRGTRSSHYQQFINNCFELLPHQALHAKSLGFEHPESRQWIEFDSVLPPGFSALLEKWRDFTSNRKKQG